VGRRRGRGVGEKREKEVKTDKKKEGGREGKRQLEEGGGGRGDLDPFFRMEETVLKDLAMKRMERKDGRQEGRQEG
jgi:hypothetical protein